MGSKEPGRYKNKMGQEWQICTDLDAMLDALKEASPRKLRLFAAACCRSIAHLITDEASLDTLNVVERHADGLASAGELGRVRARSRNAAHGDDALDTVTNATSSSAWGAAHATAHSAARAAGWASNAVDVDLAIRRETELTCNLVREIFGYPHRALPPRPKAIAPLAEAIYGGRWESIPLLGEWLQERGYWDIGEHCLDPSRRHYKGCWVVDWLLGKE
jgi:hypothetical protein